jgi:hypothetical protein
MKAMMLLYIVLLALLVFAVFVLTGLMSRRRFSALVTSEVATLFSDGGEALGPDQLAAHWDTLPEPIRRYLRYAIPKGAPAIRTVRLKHNGVFRMKPNQRWFAIRGEEYFIVNKPGFVWNGTIRIAPLFWIEIRDHLLGGQGNTLAKLMSKFTVAEVGGAEIDQGAMLRWLAEVCWFPFGLVGPNIRWEPIDDRSARAILLQGGLPVVAIFEIDEEGKLMCVRADRYGNFGGGKVVLTPWMGRCTDYRDFNGFCVPSSIEAIWDLKEGKFNPLRFRVTTLEYNVLERFQR